MRRIATAVVAAVTLAMVVASPALAGKSGGTRPSGGGTLTVRNVSAPGTDPSYGQTITFDVATTATDKPMVELDCSQNGSAVYSHSAGFYPDYPWPWLQNYQMSSSVWTGGAANCLAK